MSAGIALLVFSLVFSCICPCLQAQTSVALTPSDQFSIPTADGEINFAANGSYSKAMLTNDAWTFTDLLLNGSQPLEHLQFSAQNCNVTIMYYRVSTISFSTLRLRYSVEEQGKQVINLGISEGNSIDWSVTQNNNLLGKGDGWDIFSNGTIVVTGLTGNITIVYYGFQNFLGTSNLPFYLQHSVAIAVIVGVAATVAIAVVIKVRSKRSLTSTKKEQTQK